MTEAESAPQGVRARVRAAMAEEILEAARAELAEAGAAGLSLRAVARRLGMVPSALYRYFPSRDSLLTALIIEAYEAVGAAAEAADTAARTAGAAPLGRWLAVCEAVRDWAADNPRSWALVYGSPVPGYAAPEATVDAALAVTRVVTGIVLAADPDQGPARSLFPAPPPGLDRVLAPVGDTLLPGCGPETVTGAMMAWTALIGTVSLELFGHYEGGTTDFAAAFRYSMEVAGRLAGLAPV